jgi:hypothetical protein
MTSISTTAERVADGTRNAALNRASRELEAADNMANEGGASRSRTAEHGRDASH